MNGALVGDTDNDGANGITNEFDLSTFNQSLVVALTLIGCIIGASSMYISVSTSRSVGGNLGNKIGRRGTLMVLLAPYLIGTLGGALTPNVPILFLSRIFGGIGVGASSVIVTVYCSEVCGW